MLEKLILENQVVIMEAQLLKLRNSRPFGAEKQDYVVVRNLQVQIDHTKRILRDIGRG